MKYFNLYLICLSVIFVIGSYYFYNKCIEYDYRNHIHTVSGTIINKNIEQYESYHKHTVNAKPKYIMAIMPDDGNKYKPYDIYVGFSTYSLYNVGDKITFNVKEEYVLKNYKDYSIWNYFKVFTSIILSCICMLGFIISIFTIIFNVFKKI